jgi:hypothetical protein
MNLVIIFNGDYYLREISYRILLFISRIELRKDFYDNTIEYVELKYYLSLRIVIIKNRNYN